MLYAFPQLLITICYYKFTLLNLECSVDPFPRLLLIFFPLVIKFAVCFTFLPLFFFPFLFPLPITVTFFFLFFSHSHLLLPLSPSFFRFAYLITEALEAARTR